jgi:hypothetical protein
MKNMEKMKGQKKEAKNEEEGGKEAGAEEK